MHFLVHSAYLHRRAERVLHWIHYFIPWEGVWKLMLWGVGSFGSIAGYLLSAYFFGPPDRASQWWAVFAAAALIFMGRVNAIYSFEFFDLAELFGPDEKTAVPRFLLRRVRPVAVRVASINSAAAMYTFLLSVCFHAILQLLASFALLVFAAANLGLVGTSGATLSLTDALIASFATVGAASGDAPRLTGGFWLVLRMGLGVIVLVWAVAFVAFAMSALPRREELEALAKTTHAMEPPAAASAVPSDSGTAV